MNACKQVLVLVAYVTRVHVVGKTKAEREYCHTLYLDKVISVLETKDQCSDGSQSYLLTLQTKPGGAHNRATLSHFKENTQSNRKCRETKLIQRYR